MKMDTYAIEQARANKNAALEQLLTIEQNERLAVAKKGLKPQAADHALLKDYVKAGEQFKAIQDKQRSLAEQLAKRGWKIDGGYGLSSPHYLTVASTHPDLFKIEEKFHALFGMLKKFRLRQQAEVDAQIPAEILEVIGMK